MTSIDGVSLRVLGNVPDDLRARGWEFVPHETRIYTTIWSQLHIAVYARPFDPDIDSDDAGERPGTVVVKNGRPFLRIVTNEQLNASWEEARQDAIARMRAADARRASEVGSIRHSGIEAKAPSPS